MFGTIVYFQVPTGLTQMKATCHIAQMEQNLSDFFQKWNRIYRICSLTVWNNFFYGKSHHLEESSSLNSI